MNLFVGNVCGVMVIVSEKELNEPILDEIAFFLKVTCSAVCRGSTLLKDTVRLHIYSKATVYLFRFIYRDRQTDEKR